MRTDRSDRLAERFSRRQQAGRRGEDAFAERMDELGWSASSLRDLGEDFHVQIFDDGKPTGFSFDAQVKAMSDPDAHRVKEDPEVLRYAVEVTHLLQWEIATTPVVLVLWDLPGRRGYWQLVPAIVEALDREEPGWEDRDGKITVSIPLSHTLDDDGARSLRRLVADRLLPIVPRPETEQLFLAFSLSTEPGREALRAFKRALDHGEAVTLTGEGVPRVTMPGSLRRVYGEQGTNPVSIQIKPQPADRVLRVRVEAVSSEGVKAIPYVELRAIRSGRRQSLFSNEHQGIGLVFELMIVWAPAGKVSLQLNCRTTGLGKTPYEARDNAAFLLALCAPGARARVLNLEDGRRIFEQLGTFTEQQGNDFQEALQLLDKVCLLQSKLNPWGVLSLRDGISSEEGEWVEKLYRACLGLPVEDRADLSFDVLPDDGAQDPQTTSLAEISIVRRDGRLQLLGLDVPIGTVEDEVLERERFLAAFQEARRQAKSAGKPVHVELTDLLVLQTFHDWPPDRGDWQKLSEIALSSGGHFTRADASDAGYNDVSLELLEREHRIERCRPDVFRITTYPVSEQDHLIVLWLATGRRAVFSHHTALALHQLSDLMPSRRHLTVPTDWQGESAPFSADVVIHRADIAEAEIGWVGQVPVTKPLRTLHDCIAAGVAGEIIAQAIEDGVERGLFRAEDVDRSPRAGSPR